MINSSVSLAFEAPASRLWSVLSAWPNHSRWVPLTRVTVTKDTGGVGTVFVGRTGLGPFAFDDPMVVAEFIPPTANEAGTCVIEKTGRLIKGHAGFTVTPLTPSTCLVEWFENIEVAPVAVTRWFEPVLDWFAKKAFMGVLVKVSKDIGFGWY